MSWDEDAGGVPLAFEACPPDVPRAYRARTPKHTGGATRARGRTEGRTANRKNYGLSDEDVQAVVQAQKSGALHSLVNRGDFDAFCDHDAVNEKYYRNAAASGTEAELFTVDGCPLSLLVERSPIHQGRLLGWRPAHGAGSTGDVVLQYVTSAALFNATLRNNFVSTRGAENVRAMVKEVAMKGEVYPATTFFRGFTAWRDFDVAEIIEDPAFLSKTTSLTVATTFAKLHGWRMRSSVAIIRYAEESMHLMVNEDQREVLTFPGERFIVEDIGVLRFKAGNGAPYEFFRLYLMRYIGSMYDIDVASVKSHSPAASELAASRVMSEHPVDPSIDRMVTERVHPACERLLAARSDSTRVHALLSIRDTVNTRTLYVSHKCDRAHNTALLQLLCGAHSILHVSLLNRDQSDLTNAEYQVLAGRVRELSVINNFHVLLGRLEALAKAALPYDRDGTIQAILDGQDNDRGHCGTNAAVDDILYRYTDSTEPARALVLAIYTHVNSPDGRARTARLTAAAHDRKFFLQCMFTGRITGVTYYTADRTPRLHPARDVLMRREDYSATPNPVDFM